MTKRYFQFFWIISISFFCFSQVYGQNSSGQETIADLSKKANTKTLNPFKLAKKGKAKRDLRLATIILDSLKPGKVTKADTPALATNKHSEEQDNKIIAQNEKVAQLTEKLEKTDLQVTDLSTNVKSKVDAVHDTFFIYLPLPQKLPEVKAPAQTGVEFVPPPPDNKLSPQMATIANDIFLKPKPVKANLDAFFDSTWVNNLRSFDSADAFKYKRSLRLTRKMEVVGFHPNSGDYLPPHFYHVFSDLGIYKFTLDGLSLLYNDGPLLVENKQSYNLAVDKINDSDIHTFVTLSEHDPKKLIQFLSNKKNWHSVFNEIAGKDGILASRHCKGVILDFANMPVEIGDKYTDFVELFSNYIADTSLKLDIIVPANSPANLYAYRQLEHYIHRFIVDITKVNYPAIDRFSVGSINNVKEDLPAFLASSGVDPRKVIVGMSFQGVEWQAVKNDSFRFVHKIPFGDITSNYAQVGNNPDPPIFFFDSRDKSGYVQFKTWFDNEISFSMKLDFIQQNKCAGVAILPVIPSADDTDYFCRPAYRTRYNGLWSTMLSKSLRVDTCVDSVKVISFFERVRNQLYFYGDLLLHPRDLPNFNDYPVPFYLRNFCIILFVFILILLAYYIYKIINVGDEWKSRQLFSNLIIVLFILGIAFVLMYVFLDPELPIGIRSDKKRTPFTTYLIILASGIVAGILIMNFLKLVSNSEKTDE